MLISNVLAMALAAQGPAAESQVAYDLLVDGRNEAAIVQIEQNDALEANDPARLINLGIAYAREGRTADARAMFEAAMRSEERASLETADGEWKDSRHLAYRALAMLERGDFHGERMAAR